MRLEISCRLAPRYPGQPLEEGRPPMPAQLRARLAAGGHVVELKAVALALECLVAVPNRRAVGEDQQRAVHRRYLDHVVLQVVRVAQQAEAAIVLTECVGSLVEVE